MSRLNKPVTLSFTKRLPKIELHAHLSGSISRTCLHEIWLKKKAVEPNLTIADPLIALPAEKVDFDVHTFFPLFGNYIYQLCSSLDSIRHSTFSVLKDFTDDGCVYLELRTTPRAIPTQGITKEEYVHTVLTCITEFEQRAAMPTHVILSIDRRNTAAEAMEVVDLAIKHAPHGVVGVDLCGDPMTGDPAIFRAAFAKAKAHGLKITLHFAEVPASGTREELETLLSFGPDRLGHVIHVPKDVEEKIIGRGLGLELCLSGNINAKLVEGGFVAHHFGWWRERVACPVVLCTDDVGVFMSSLSNEYFLAATHFGLDRKGLIELVERGVDAIFGEEMEKERIRGLIRAFEELEQ